MPDRTSNYRQIRLTINVGEVSGVLTWQVTAIGVRRGIPTASVIDSGLVRGPYDVSTQEGIALAVRDINDVFCSRWMLA